jgi:hypothetical protein
MNTNRNPQTIFRDVREISAVVPGTARKSERRIGSRLIRVITAYLPRWMRAGSENKPPVAVQQIVE